MSATSSAPGGQEKRFAAYLDRLAQAAEHVDRVEPLKSYCKGLLLPGERKSVEPMAARLAPHDVRQSVLPQMEHDGPVIAWIVDDTGFLKKGTHSVGVARQYCGQVGKQDNCQVAVSLSIATEHASLPIAWRLYLPETWAEDEERRKAAGVPKEISFQSKWAIALEQIRKAVRDGLATAPALADAGYGDSYDFREGITQLRLRYVVGVRERTTIWEPGESPLPPK